MSEQITQAMTRPTVEGSTQLPKRNGAKSLLPLSWVGRTIRVEYRGADGRERNTSGMLLDLYPTGLLIGIKSARTLLSWDAVVVVELIED
jgi:hypothetical protein